MRDGRYYSGGGKVQLVAFAALEVYWSCQGFGSGGRNRDLSLAPSQVPVPRGCFLHPLAFIFISFYKLRRSLYLSATNTPSKRD